MEYYFEKINDNYALDVIDEMENKPYFGTLFDVILWHKKMNEISEYIKLKKYIYDKK